MFLIKQKKEKDNFCVWGDNMKRQIIEVNINALSAEQLEQLTAMIYENANNGANDTAEEMKKVAQINHRWSFVKGYMCVAKEKEYREKYC